MAREGELVKVEQRITAYHIVLARQQVRDPWGRLNRHRYKAYSLWTFLPDFDSIFFFDSSISTLRLDDMDSAKDTHKRPRFDFEK